MCYLGKKALLLALTLLPHAGFGVAHRSLVAASSSSSNSSSSSSSSSRDRKQERGIDRASFEKKVSEALPKDFTKSLIPLVTNYTYGWVPVFSQQATVPLTAALVLPNGTVVFGAPDPDDDDRFAITIFSWNPNSSSIVLSSTMPLGFQASLLDSIMWYRVNRKYAPAGVVVPSPEGLGVNDVLVELNYIPTKTSIPSEPEKISSFNFLDLRTSGLIEKLNFPFAEPIGDRVILANVGKSGIASSWGDCTTIRVWNLRGAAWTLTKTITSDLPVSALCGTGRMPKEGDLAATCYNRKDKKLYFRCWNSDSGQCVMSKGLSSPFELHNCDAGAKCSKLHGAPVDMVWLSDNSFVVTPEVPRCGFATIMGIEKDAVVPRQRLITAEDEKLLGVGAGTFDSVLLPNGRILTISGSEKHSKRIITVWRHTDVTDDLVSSTTDLVSSATVSTTSSSSSTTIPSSKKCIIC